MTRRPPLTTEQELIIIQNASLGVKKKATAAEANCTINQLNYFLKKNNIDWLKPITAAERAAAEANKRYVEKQQKEKFSKLKTFINKEYNPRIKCLMIDFFNKHGIQKAQLLRNTNDNKEIIASLKGVLLAEGFEEVRNWTTAKFKEQFIFYGFCVKNLDKKVTLTLPEVEEVYQMFPFYSQTQIASLFKTSYNGLKSFINNDQHKGYLQQVRQTVREQFIDRLKTDLKTGKIGWEQFDRCYGLTTREMKALKREIKHSKQLTKEEVTEILKYM